MVDQVLIDDLKELIKKDSSKTDSQDVLKIFELYKQISEEVDYLKGDLNEEEMIGQINFTDLEEKYWFNGSNGKVEYGKGSIEKPLFTISCTKEVGFGLFLGELDANIIAPLGKLNVRGNVKNLRAFQEFYEDAIEEFQKRY